MICAGIIITVDVRIGRYVLINPDCTLGMMILFMIMLQFILM